MKIIIIILAILGEAAIIKIYLASNRSKTAIMFFGGVALLFAALMIMIENWISHCS